MTKAMKEAQKIDEKNNLTREEESSRTEDQRQHMAGKQEHSFESILKES